MLWGNVVFGTLFMVVFLAIAIRLWNREPAVLAPRAIMWILGLAFAPALLGGIAAVVLAVAEGEFVLLLAVAPSLAMFVLLLVFFRRIVGRAVVMNVDETSLYDAIESTLDRHDLTHHEERSTIDVAEHDATIEVNYQAATNSGTVNVRGDDQRDLFPVLEDLREALKGRKLEKRSKLAVFYLAFAILFGLSNVGFAVLAA